MSGRDPISVHRSLQLFLSTFLPSEWDIQPVRKEPQQRPLAVVRPVGPAPSSGTAYVREFDQPYEVFAYPAGVESDPYASEVEARAYMAVILRALDSGTTVVGPRRGYALRVPLFDFLAIGLDEPLPVDATPVDYLVIRQPSGVARPDPEADDLFTVTIDFRANWRDDGDISRFEGATLESVTVAHQA